MAFIGENDETGLSSAGFADTDSHALFVASAYQFTAGASDEVFRFGAYLNGASSQIEIGLYDVTSGADGATLVGSTQTLTGLSGANWITADFAGIALTNGNTYTVGWRSIAASSIMYRTYTADATNFHATLDGTSALSTWAVGSGLSQRYAVYAETQASAPSNSAPVVNDQTFSVADSASIGTVIGTVVATDSDGTVDSYAISGTTLAINSTTGQITLAGIPIIGLVAGTPITATVTVTDNNGDTDTATVTVNVTNAVLTDTLLDAENSNAAIANETSLTIHVYDTDGGTELYSTASATTDGSGVFVVDDDAIGVLDDIVFVVIKRSNGQTACGTMTVVDGAV